MDYEKKLALAKEALDSGSYDKETIEYIFPELKESEDERIRKWIKKELESKYVVDNIVNNVMADKALAWLEKQGEQKPVDNKFQEFKDKLCELFQRFRWYKDETPTNGDILEYVEAHIQELLGVVNEQKSTDKVELKFKVGDWVVTSYGKVNQVVSVDKDGDGYTLDDGVYFSGSWCDIYHLWTIQDAKDGDVLATSAGAFIYNGNNGGGSCPGSYCGINTLGKFKTGVKHHWTGKKVYPATKEQRDQLEKAMTDAGYTFDFEKKELKKIEQTPAWSEEDDTMLNEIIASVNGFDATSGTTTMNFGKHEAKINWIKTIKYKALAQLSDEWSEEDETSLSDIIKCLEEHKHCMLTEEHDIRINLGINFLKSFKYRVQPQPKQEWSEEDESRFNNLIFLVGHSDENKATKEGFIKFINKLKSLKDRVLPFDDKLTKECFIKALERVKELKDKGYELTPCDKETWYEDFIYNSHVSPQSHWKPSDEQMRVLDLAIRCGINRGTTEETTLVSLFNDLKKLK